MFFILIISSFLLFAVPVFTGTMISIYFKWDFNKNRFKKVFFMGMLFYLLAQASLLIIGIFYPVNYNQLPLFFNLWIKEIFVIILIAASGYFLMLKKDMFRVGSYREYPFIFSYLSGFFFLSGLIKIISSLFKFDTYILFLYPLISISMIMLISIILIEAGTRRGYTSILFYSLLLPLSLGMVLVPWSYYLSYIPAALGLTFVVLFGSGITFYVLKKDYIRG